MRPEGAVQGERCRTRHSERSRSVSSMRWNHCGCAAAPRMPHIRTSAGIASLGSGPRVERSAGKAGKALRRWTRRRARTAGSGGQRLRPCGRGMSQGGPPTLHGGPGGALSEGPRMPSWDPARSAAAVLRWRALIRRREISVPVDETPVAVLASVDLGDTQRVRVLLAVQNQRAAFVADRVGEVGAVVDHLVLRTHGPVTVAAGDPVERATHVGPSLLARAEGAEQGDVVTV